MSVLIYWQAVLLSAVLVFFVSAIVWMVMPWHKSDFKAVPDEESARAALKGIQPGHYMIPHCINPKELEDEVMKQRFIDGPIAYFSVQESGLPEMGPRMLKIFLFYLFVSGLCAYLLDFHGAEDASYLDTFQLTGTVAWAAYGLAHIQDSVWFAKPWSITLKNIFDAFIYALVTGGVFGWLA
ncbi:MAG: hypothetical protein AAGA44_14160 [Pseudomonadota bacterium]